MRRFLAFLAIPAVGVIAAGLIPAGSGANVAANATFDGVVNGSTAAATVFVTCPVGAVAGVVAPGQTWGVIAGTHGQMGDFGGSITAQFPLQPLGASTFSNLGETATIPALNVLPCSGIGTVVFIPNDFGANKKTTEVGVQFVGVAS
jgi:hypothetical protein